MALTDFKPHFDNAYQEIFQKTLTAKSVMNTRFEPVLKYGESIERVAYDISNVMVRPVVRGSDSTIDNVTDTSELLTINLEYENAFRISDGEVKQAGPLNPGEEIGKQLGRKLAVHLDGKCYGEILNASFAFDTGDLTTGTSTGVPFALTSTTVPQLTTRMSAKLSSRNNIDTSNGMVFVTDSYGAADIDQFLISKNIDLAGYVFKNGYAGLIRGAEMVISENLPSSAVLTGSGTFSNGETITINGTVFTAVSSIGSTAGNFLIGANLAASLTNLAGLINAPTTTSSTQVAFTAVADIENVQKFTAVAAATTVTITGIGTGRLILAETAANASWGSNTLICYYGKKGAIDLAIQDMKEVDMRPESRQRATIVFSSYLAGIKTFADGAKKFLKVLIAA